MSIKDQAAKFAADKKQLNPFWKPETNIPANIILVRSVKADQGENQQGEKYAVLSLVIDLEMDEEIVTKTWNVTSGVCVDSLVEKGVDVGSSFTVLAKGEGINKKFEITNVVNKEKVAPVAQGVSTGTAPAATSSTTAGATVQP